MTIPGGEYDRKAEKEEEELLVPAELSSMLEDTVKVQLTGASVRVTFVVAGVRKGVHCEISSFLCCVTIVSSVHQIYH